ncbi:hypothetical protein [Pseudomonas syringae]|uniref:hypothetical protein n=1 Tax=Pseudomonas syringae TaxID=317 RepID=UPI000BB6758D|nr:hypothetical protein [Pseudomonas syringae]PBP85415.1 hypothetical protein CCL20_17250 [Pseudomonas syringae]PHN78328.1 hypothetical protein AO071_22700 [Pseudomonas syringae]
MNIESLSRLIESVNVTDLRTLCAEFLPLIGLPGAVFSDGPYDGGKDYAIYEDTLKGIKIGVQLSVESKWKKKVHTDAAKTKNKYNTNLMYFISSRRIPDGNFEDERSKILSTLGVTVLKFDSQAIATKFIQNNKINSLLDTLNIKLNSTPEISKKYLGAKNEAISSLLLFDNNAQDFRAGLYDSIVKSVLSRQTSPIKRANLISTVLNIYEMDDSQGVLINSHIDRLLQKKEILSSEGSLSLHKNVLDEYQGLRAAAELESQILIKTISDYLATQTGLKNPKSHALLIDNFLELSAALIEKNFTLTEETKIENGIYSQIRALLDSNEGTQATDKAFFDIAQIVADSDFAKLVASAKLYDCMLNSDSSRLISALGGHQSINVYFDSSVVIPLLCGLLYETVEDRYSRSGKSLYSLMQSHEFSSVIPSDYAEEIGAHLIEACRDYKEILNDGEDMSRSGNAFVSHFSHYRQTPKGKDLSFEDYVYTFGIKLFQITAGMQDPEFYRLRDRATREISKIATKYGFEVLEINSKFTDKKVKELKDFMLDSGIKKPDILIRHDAKVIQYLSGANVPSGYAKILCTWDKVHLLINPSGVDGYHVMNPIVLIDFLSIAKKTAKQYSLAHLLDFASIQNEKDLELSAEIWDSIAKLDGRNLSDANFMNKAKRFKEDFLEKHLEERDNIPANIENAWLAWKKSEKEN